MSLEDLLALYFVAGAACAVAVYRRAPRTRWMSAALTIPLWPLWAPVALTRDRPCRAGSHGRDSDAAARIRRALAEGVEACVGTPMERLLSSQSAERIVEEVCRTEARRDELDAVLQRRELDIGEARAQVAELASGSSATPRVLASARLHLANVERLTAIRDRDQRALTELAALLEALRTQLVLARYAGSSVEGAGAVVQEVWERVESLGEVMEEGGISRARMEL